MSELPFMQLYVGDYFKDTRRLTCEEHGAYLLLLMTMWSEGGGLPDDDEELARVVLLPLEQWLKVRAKIIRFFVTDGAAVTHKRLRAELNRARDKSTTRAMVGAKGGRKTADKSKANDAAIGEAIASPNNGPFAGASDAPIGIGLPQHSSEIRDQKEQQQAPPGFLAQALAILGLDFEQARRGHAGLLQAGPLQQLISRGYSLEDDILPAIREWNGRRKQGRLPGTWNYFMAGIVEYAQRRSAIPDRAAVPALDWAAIMRGWRADQTWIAAWGPKPGEAGCRVPAEFLDEAPQ